MNNSKQSSDTKTIERTNPEEVASSNQKSTLPKEAVSTSSELSQLDARKAVFSSVFKEIASRNRETRTCVSCLLEKAELGDLLQNTELNSTKEDSELLEKLNPCFYRSELSEEEFKLLQEVYPDITNHELKAYLALHLVLKGKNFGSHEVYVEDVISNSLELLKSEYQCRVCSYCIPLWSLLISGYEDHSYLAWAEIFARDASDENKQKFEQAIDDYWRRLDPETELTSTAPHGRELNITLIAYKFQALKFISPFMIEFLEKFTNLVEDKWGKCERNDVLGREVKSSLCSLIQCYEKTAKNENLLKETKRRLAEAYEKFVDDTGDDGWNFTRDLELAEKLYREIGDQHNADRLLLKHKEVSKTAELRTFIFKSEPFEIDGQKFLNALNAQSQMVSSDSVVDTLVKLARLFHLVKPEIKPHPLSALGVFGDQFDRAPQNPELGEWSSQISNAVIWQTCVYLEQIRKEHQEVPLEVIKEFVKDSSFIPKTHREIIATGLSYGFKGEWLAASAILIPNFENCCRHLLESSGICINKKPSRYSKLSEVVNLGELFSAGKYCQPLQKQLGEAIFDMAKILLLRQSNPTMLREVQVISMRKEPKVSTKKIPKKDLKEEVGFNLRHNFAHGRFVDGDTGAYKTLLIYFWHMFLKLIYQHKKDKSLSTDQLSMPEMEDYLPILNTKFDFETPAAN